MRLLPLALLALALVASLPAAAATPSRVWGVTLDDDAGIAPAALAAQVDALRSLPVRPTSRIVLDWGTSVGDYARAIPAIHRVSGVLGQLADSSEVKGVRPEAYRRWVQRFVAAYRDDVDTWEVGNEVNGEWVGTPAEEMARVRAAYDVVRAAGGRTALTLYYNPSCWAKPRNAMFRWLADGHVPRTLAAGLDDVTISYYPADCNGYWPGAAGWQRVFDRLHAIFPHARLGFGESGRTGTDLLGRYTSVHVRGDNFVGGYFWWTWAEDAVPKTKPFWAAYAAAQQ